jgi:FlaG/FlaF family flagellin (archaellin)
VNKMNKNTIIIIAIALVMIAGIGGFLGGMQYQKSQPRAFGQFAGRNFGGANGQGGQFGQNVNFRPVRGQVLNAGSNSLTVKLSDGSTKIVVLSTSTTFVKSQKAASTDLKTGDTVNVLGTQNSDGSVTAQDVQINPPGRPQTVGQN